MTTQATQTNAIAQTSVQRQMQGQRYQQPYRQQYGNRQMQSQSPTRENSADTQDVTVRFRPTLAFYHPNAQGTGAALKLEMHPAHDNTDGSIWATMAPQTSIANRRGPTPVFAHFGWESSITVKLDFTDLTKMLMVFRGEAESIEDGKGLLHVTPKGSTKIILRHAIEPVNGYSLEFYRTSGGCDSSVRIFLFANEALGLTKAIESSFGVICFGIPVVIPRDTSAYRASRKEMDNAPAA